MKVSILPLKQRLREFPDGSTLRELILIQPDELEQAELDAKVTVWVELLQLETKKIGDYSMPNPTTFREPSGTSEED